MVFSIGEIHCEFEPKESSCMAYGVGNTRTLEQNKRCVMRGSYTKLPSRSMTFTLIFGFLLCVLVSLVSECGVLRLMKISRHAT